MPACVGVGGWVSSWCMALTSGGSRVGGHVRQSWSEERPGTCLIPWQFLRVHSSRLLTPNRPVPAFPPMGTHNCASLSLYVVSNRAEWLVCSGTCLYFWRHGCVAWVCEICLLACCHRVRSGIVTEVHERVAVVDTTSTTYSHTQHIFTEITGLHRNRC